MRTRSSEGTAVALSFTSLAIPKDKKYAVGLRYGYFEDESAIGFQMAGQLDQLVLDVGLGYGFNYEQLGFTAAATWGW